MTNASDPNLPWWLPWRAWRSWRETVRVKPAGWTIAAGAVGVFAAVALGSGAAGVGQVSWAPTPGEGEGPFSMLDALVRSVIGHRTLTTQLSPKPGQTEISFDFALRPQ